MFFSEEGTDPAKARVDEARAAFASEQVPVPEHFITANASNATENFILVVNDDVECRGVKDGIAHATQRRISWSTTRCRAVIVGTRVDDVAFSVPFEWYDVWSYMTSYRNQ